MAAKLINRMVFVVQLDLIKLDVYSVIKLILFAPVKILT